MIPPGEQQTRTLYGNRVAASPAKIPTAIAFLFAELDPEQIKQGNKGLCFIAANLTGIGGCHIDVWLWGAAEQDRNKLSELIIATCQLRPIEIIYAPEKVCQWLRRERHWGSFQESWKNNPALQTIMPPALMHVHPLIWGSDDEDRAVRIQRLQEWNRNAPDGYPVLRFTKEVQQTTLFQNHIKDREYSLVKEALAGLLMVVPNYQIALQKASPVNYLQNNSNENLLLKIAQLNAENKELENKISGNQ
jgi:hypothetical protein